MIKAIKDITKNMSLNEIFFNTQNQYEMYLQTNNKMYLKLATYLYYDYKIKKGRKIIDRLENELIRYELEYI